MFLLPAKPAVRIILHSLPAVETNTYYYLVAGIVILTLSLFRYQIKRKQREAVRVAERRAAAKAAAEAEQKRQQQMGEKVKKDTYSDRIPLPKPVLDTFTGGVPPKQILKWELEIDEIGRRMLGQLDSKMSALQAMILESNRIANRMEILAETLEKYKNSLRPGNGAADNKTENEEWRTGTGKTKNTLQRNNSPLVLDDLEAELDQFQEKIQRIQEEKPLPVTILKESATTDEPATVPFSGDTAAGSLGISGKSNVGSTFDSLFSEKSGTYHPVLPAIELKKQIKTLADYGYDSRQIAQNLNITIGEVDLVLSLRE